MIMTQGERDQIAANVQAHASIAELTRQVEGLKSYNASLHECNTRQAATIGELQAAAPVERAGDEDTFDALRQVVELVREQDDPLSILAMATTYLRGA